MQLPAKPDGQVHEGIVVLVPCPADGDDGGLRGAELLLSPITDSSAPELLSSAGKPPGQTQAPHGWWKLLQTHTQAGPHGQTATPALPTCGRAQAQATGPSRSRGSPLVNSPACGGGRRLCARATHRR